MIKIKKIIVSYVVFLIIAASFISVAQGALDISSNKKEEDAEFWGLIITILDYEGEINDLPEDGLLVNSYRLFNMTSAAKNWKSENIIFLRNENATKINITNALVWLKDNSDEKDTIFFYFLGHGSQISDYDGDEKDGIDEVICPYDFKRNSEGDIINYLSDDELGIYFNQINAKGMFLIFESCFSGGLFNNTTKKTNKITNFTQKRNLNDEFAKDITEINRVIIVASSEQKPASFAQLMHAHLSYAINPNFDHEEDPYLKILSSSLFKIPVDKNKDNILTAEELSSFVKYRVVRFWTINLFLLPIFRWAFRLALIRLYKDLGFFPSFIPKIYDGYVGDLPIIEL